MSTPPSRLVLLSELPSLSLNTKVRFIGCVQAYDIPSATLILSSLVPAPRLDSSRKLGDSDHSAPLAYVSAKLVLPPVSSKDLFQPGTWINVMGYTNAAPSCGESDGVAVASSADAEAGTKLSTELHQRGYVTATLLFEARTKDPAALLETRGNDSLARGRYEDAVRARRKGGLALRGGLAK